VSHALSVLAVMPSQADPYAPRQKGKVERFFRTLTDEFASQHPAFVRRPRRADRDPYAPASNPVGLRRLGAELDEWIHAYDTTRPHSALHGLTPLERWNSARFAPRIEAARDLAFLLKERVLLTVNRDGIHVDNVKFTAPELARLVGQKVEVAKRPFDRSLIEVFVDDEWLCTAVPHESLDAQARDRLLAIRHEDDRVALELHRKASTRERSLLGGLPQPSDGQSEPEKPARRLKSSTSLFGLE
jgi:hypothetical protein